MPNIRRFFNTCLVLLFVIFSSALYAAVMIPAKICYPDGSFAVNTRAEQLRIAVLAVLWCIWAVLIGVVNIAPVLKALRKR